MIISVTGGKGGTGKSFIATCLALTLAKRGRTVLVDADFENPNSYLLLGLSSTGECKDLTVFLPGIDASKCNSCGICRDVCDSGAIIVAKGSKPIIIPRLCSGCRACMYACPQRAIYERRKVVGKICITNVKVGVTLDVITAMMVEGEEHPLPVASNVIDNILEVGTDYDYIVIDIGAGTAADVAMYIRISDKVTVVVEPTPLSVHDALKVLDVVKRYRKSFVLVVNKKGIARDPDELQLLKQQAENCIEIPYNRRVVELYTSGKLYEIFEDEYFRTLFETLTSIITSRCC